MKDINAFRKFGLNVEEGVSFCAEDPDFYEEMLSDFADAAPREAEALNTALSENDLAAYAITVHALKSSSKMIGARDLSEKARELEQAAKSKDADAVKAAHGAFIAELETLAENIRGELRLQKEDLYGETV
ncbi:MAG: Hpt domain-containing protein [Clostridia bacterium]|nr:Hpt domain-containing protein [Clostridia bacterium]